MGNGGATNPSPTVTNTGPTTTSVPTPPPPPTDTPVFTDDAEDECVPTTCAELGFNCGQASDGCGELLECGTCAANELCGGALPNVCLGPPACIGASSCAELGWACGIAFDACGNTFDCTAEGRTCLTGEVCVASAEGPTLCQTGIGGPAGCDLCDSLPDCEGQAQPTRISGRVITAGRSDDNTANQVGVPNAFVYIITNNKVEDLPTIEPGIPEGGTSCDKCEGQDLGPLMEGATTDALGNYVIEGNIPVGEEFLLVVKVGRFRRAVQMTLEATAACATTEIPHLSTRLPRDMMDGLAVNIPRVGFATGDIDAMECVFEKMGVAHTEFNVPGAGATNPERIHFYGTDGAEMPGGNPDEDLLYGDLLAMTSYDMLVFDCQGAGYLNPPEAIGLDNVREFVNRGGRLFLSHLGFQWLCRSDDTPYSADDPIATGLAPAASFPECNVGQGAGRDMGTGVVSLGRPQANPNKIDAFSQWLINENAATLQADGTVQFPITDPRSLAVSISAFPNAEEFVYEPAVVAPEPPEMDGGAPFPNQGDDDVPESVQQFAFNTPYGAPEDATCGRVAYSAFHVADGDNNTSPFADAEFPEHCTGDLTAQEKVLLYMLFDLGACIGDPPEPPVCEPTSCEAQGAECGLISDGCGLAVDCGPCPPGEVCGLEQPNQCSACVPITCDDAPIECGFTGDGCGGQLLCECPPDQQCGAAGPNRCGSIADPE